MVDTERLKEVIKEKGLKKQWIAEQLGLSRYGLQKKINGENEFLSSEVLNLCKLLDITSLEEKESIFFKQ